MNSERARISWDVEESVYKMIPMIDIIERADDKIPAPLFFRDRPTGFRFTIIIKNEARTRSDKYSTVVFSDNVGE